VDLKVETAGLYVVKVAVSASPALVEVCTISFVHSRTQRKPARKSKTAKKMVAACEYCHSVCGPSLKPAIIALELEVTRGMNKKAQHFLKTSTSCVTASPGALI
jgi:hypothetical protein